MESKYQKITTIILAVLLWGCAIENTEKPLVEMSDGFSSVRTGDIICRRGNGYFSHIFSRFSGTDGEFSHAGFIYLSNDSIYVIHADANEFTGRGNVRIEPAINYIRDSKSYELFSLRIDTADAARAADIAMAYARANTPFDNRFSIDSDSALYCTELIATCVNQATDSTTILPYTAENGFCFYRIREIIDMAEK